jgi:tetratricopeptide (TPR) repeat protein
VSTAESAAPHLNLKAFRAALLDAYRDYRALKIFVHDALEKNLNEIIGSDEGIKSVVFELLEWSDAKKRLTDLYDYFCEDNPDHPFSQPIADEPTLGAATPTNLNRYHRSIPQFVGRDRAMADLTTLLTACETIAIAAAVSGMGGLGKTELAWQWANREYRAGRFPGGVVWLDVAAGNPGEQLILFCQTEFKVELPELPTIAERVGYCWQHWSEWRSGEVLVVFDDVSRDRDAEMIRDLQPGGSPFRTLWTTRDDWAGVQRYRLDKLDDAAARQLLASYIDASRLDAEPDAIEALLRWFDGLPLGLELAARYLALDDWLSIADYLDELTLTHESLQANREMRYPDGVEAAIAVSWARLNPETEDGRAALRLALRLALFGAAPIPVLADWKQAWRQPLQRLVGLNLVDRDRVAVALHPLVRQFVRGRLAVELSEEEGDQLRREVAAAIVAQGQQIEYRFTMAQAREYAPWIPHLEEVAAGLLAWVVDESVIEPCNRIARFYQGQGLYGLAEPWKERCVAVVRERLGDRHADTATALNNLAGLYESQGKYEEAEPLYREALAIDRESLPANHPDLAIDLNNLAGLYRAQGKYEAAEPLYRKALVIDRESHPANHPSLATGLNNLAGLYRAQGKYEAAEPLYREALVIVRESLPANHPDLARDLNNLAELYRVQGKYEAAEPLYREALVIVRESLPANHPQLATHLNNLALLYESQEKYEEAEPLYLECLSIFMVSLGDDHPNTQTVLVNVIDFYQTALAAGHPYTRLRNHPLGDLIRSRLQ